MNEVWLRKKIWGCVWGERESRGDCRREKRMKIKRKTKERRESRYVKQVKS